MPRLERLVRIDIGGVIDLDEDALTRADFGGMDHVGDQPHRNNREAPRSTRVVERFARLAHVRDAVLEQDEHLRAMVHAQAVTCAQILVDPHVHYPTQPTERRRL